MRRLHRLRLACLLTGFLACVLTWLPMAASAADCGCGSPTCTDPACCQPCAPACKATWDETKTKKPRYSIRCEHACARGYDCWCSDPAECRCQPPGGKIYVKKRLFKADGEEKVEKVPKYEVAMVPAEPCDCARCSGVCWWNPLAVLRYLAGTHPAH